MDGRNEDQKEKPLPYGLKGGAGVLLEEFQE
jgi:hypothetical protein